LPGVAFLKTISGHARVEENIVGSPMACQSGCPPGLDSAEQHSRS
jgi:hypothetical protein